MDGERNGENVGENVTHSICTHGRVRSKCKDCGGGSICTHGIHRDSGFLGVPGATVGCHAHGLLFTNALGRSIHDSRPLLRRVKRHPVKAPQFGKTFMRQACAAGAGRPVELGHVVVTGAALTSRCERFHHRRRNRFAVVTSEALATPVVVHAHPRRRPEVTARRDSFAGSGRLAVFSYDNCNAAREGEPVPCSCKRSRRHANNRYVCTWLGSPQWSQHSPVNVSPQPNRDIKCGVHLQPPHQQSPRLAAVRVIVCNVVATPSPRLLDELRPTTLAELRRVALDVP